MGLPHCVISWHTIRFQIILNLKIEIYKFLGVVAADADWEIWAFARKKSPQIPATLTTMLK